MEIFATDVNTSKAVCIGCKMKKARELRMAPIIENMNLGELLSVMYDKDGDQLELEDFEFLPEGESFDLYLGETPKRIKVLAVECDYLETTSNCYTVFEVEGQRYIVYYRYESYEGVRLTGKEIVSPAVSYQRTMWTKA